MPATLASAPPFSVSSATKPSLVVARAVCEVVVVDIVVAVEVVEIVPALER